MTQRPHYHQARLHFHKAAKLEAFASLTNVLSYLMVGMGGLLAAVTAVLIATSSAINPWCFGPLAVVVLLQAPLFAVISAGLNRQARAEYEKERSNRQVAALLGETPWLQPDALSS